MQPVNIDYSKTVIYKIYCKNPDVKECYIGHTTNLRNRKSHHKTNCNNINGKGYNRKVYKIIRDNGGFDNWKFAVLEEAELENKLQAEKLERKWIEEIKPICNYQLPAEYFKENQKEYKKLWYEKNKEIVLEKAKVNYDNNKEQKLEYQKVYALEKKDKITDYQKEYREKNSDILKEQKKIYREENSEKLKAGQQEWRTKNREKLQEQRKQLIICECGLTFTLNNKSRHCKSQKHIDLISEIS